MVSIPSIRRVDCGFCSTMSLLSTKDRIVISPLPPEVLLHAGPHGGHEVVEVHDDVHAHVEEPAEGGVAASHKPAMFPVIVIARFTAN